MEKENILLAEEEKNGEGKEERYFEKETIVFCRGGERWRREGRNIFAEGEYTFLRRKKRKGKKEENI